MDNIKPGDRLVYKGGGPCAFSVQKGTICIVESVEEGCVRYHTEDNSHTCVEDKYFFERISSMDNLQNGDVLSRDGFTYDRIVLAVTDDYIVTADSDDGDVDVESLEVIKADQWFIKGSQPETVEMTLEDVAQKVGVPVEKLRIKD